MAKKIGIIGGSGLEDSSILSNPIEHTAYTPYGDPSSPLLSGVINGVEVVLLSRHGHQHTIPPTQVNNRANIRALKDLGCTHLLTTTACGSLREDIGRGDIAIADQFIDFTRHRQVTFYDTFLSGKMKHEPMADPFDKGMRSVLIEEAKKAGIRYHPSGTIITIEGPRFSTRAESKMFRMWGADLVNMSIAPEVILAKEAGLPYATIAISTDYDCWKEDEEPVSWEEVIKVFNRNVENVIDLIICSIRGF
ncbi:MAG TPA: S-methyl-5'-thioadenosine phosphorylase [Bacteroidales bacterium]|nr:S-methyl-5'-thioadenosine phosphorylase [Bacteroidales bacterium]